MWAKVIGGAVIISLASLLVWVFGNARYATGELAERAKWQQQMRNADARQKKLELQLAERPVKAMTVYVDRVTQMQPIVQRMKETVREYAQTADGAKLCLPYERVRGIEQERQSIFFPDYPAPTGQGAGAVPAGPAAAPGNDQR
jgi:hypothetical protein